MTNLIQYVTESKIFFQTGSSPSNCNSILFVNTGTVNVTVDGLQLVPNQSFQVDGNQNEINVKTYYFTFAASSGAALTIIYKKYI